MKQRPLKEILEPDLTDPEPDTTKEREQAIEEFLPLGKNPLARGKGQSSRGTGNGQNRMGTGQKATLERTLEGNKSKCRKKPGEKTNGTEMMDLGEVSREQKTEI